MKPLRVLTAGVILAACLAGCKKDDSTTHLKIKLTDNPYNASQVNVDIEQVRVKFSDDGNDNDGWINLQTRPGIYNLLDLQNGIDTLVADAIVPKGVLKEIRFVLGSDNSIKIDNNVYPLTIPSGSESGLKVKLSKSLRADLDSLVIDFDAALSVIQEGTGDYKLKPVLKIK